MDIAVKAVAWASFLNSGQVCTSAERIYVHKDIYRPFLERLKTFAEGLHLGEGMSPVTDVGPMIGEPYRRKVERQVHEALQQGAKLVAGGRKPPQFKRGFFFEPTVLSDVNHQMAVMRDETFGPVCPVMSYARFDDAIKLANDSIYGLGANLYTHDSRKVKKFFEDVHAGTIWINDPLTDNDAGPFGGYKASGGSRELGEEGLSEFQQPKHIHWDFEQKVKPWWYPYGPKKQKEIAN